MELLTVTPITFAVGIETCCNRLQELFWQTAFVMLLCKKHVGHSTLLSTAWYAHGAFARPVHLSALESPGKHAASQEAAPEAALGLDDQLGETNAALALITRFKSIGLVLCAPIASASRHWSWHVPVMM